MSNFQSLASMFQWRASQSPEDPALWFKQEGRYRFISWREFVRSVEALTLALDQEGVRPGDRVGLLSENRPEWAFADLALLSLGAVTVPLYPSCSSKECHYILKHAGVSLAFVSTTEQLEKIKPLLQEGSLKKVVLFDAFKSPSPQIGSLPSFREGGERVRLNNPDLYAQRVRRVRREDLATLIYTSGTTGPPKGVMLTHGNFLSNCEAASQVLPLKVKGRSLSFLPLSHVFERMAGYYFMIQQGIPIAYAESMQTVPEDLLRVRPIVAASVPRLYEKMYARILEIVKSSPPLRQKIFAGSIAVGKKVATLRHAGKPIPFFLRLQEILAGLLVFRKLKNKLGGRLRFFISGGAPLAKELAEFFYVAGVLILEGYGLTETSPVISVNRPDRFKFGTVGLALPGVEVRVAEDGEILTRGPHVMKGYYQNEEATRETIRDGWFYTGDLGEIDREGFLSITGRKKDIIVTAGGKNISPQNIENVILADPLFSQAVVIGDRRPYLVALLVPNREELGRTAKADQISFSSWEDLLKQPQILNLIQKRLSLRMRDFASYEQIRYFHLLPQELTQEAGEMTPTLKVKRRVVMERYARQIEGLYQQGEAFVKARGREPECA